jgi:hypothetical protein
MEAEAEITENVEHGRDLRMEANPTKSLDKLLKDLQEKHEAAEQERVVANLIEKSRRSRDGTPPDYQAYYEANSGSVYYISDTSGDWIRVQESGVRRYLMIEKGVSTKKFPTNIHHSIKRCTTCIRTIQSATRAN